MKRLFFSVFQGTKAELTKFISQKSFLKNYFLCYACYCLGFASLLHANYVARPDLNLLYHVSPLTVSNFDAVNKVISFLMFAGYKVQDISPIPQFIAISFLALSSMILTCVFSKKITTFKVLIATIFGLSPYFLPVITTRFNCLTEAFSFLLTVIPFLFYAKKRLFYIYSLISLFVIGLFYWPAWCVYLVLYILKEVQSVLSVGRLTKGNVIALALWQIVGLGLFVGIYHISPFPLISSLKEYIIRYWGHNFLGISFLISTLFFGVFMIYAFVKHIKNISKADAFLWAIYLFLLISSISVMGMNFQHHFLNAVGLGVFFVAIPMIMMESPSKVWKSIGYMIGFILIYQLILFGNKYGNILLAQKQYEQTHFELISDYLSENKIKNVIVSGDKLYSPLVLFKANEYPLYQDLIFFDLSDSSPFYTYMNALLNAYITPCQNTNATESQVLQETADWRITRINQSCVKVDIKQ